jgi:hypothetical protein
MGDHSNQVLSRRQRRTSSYCNLVAPVFVCYWRHPQVLPRMDQIVQPRGQGHILLRIASLQIE